MNWQPIVNAVAIIGVHAIALYGGFSSQQAGAVDAGRTALDNEQSVISSVPPEAESTMESPEISSESPETPSTASNPYEIPADRAIGNPEAKVTVIEYASVTCGHCADFHKSTYKKIKENYIDSGKIRFIFREFPTAPADRAYAGFLLARCVPADKYFGVIDALMRRQDQWAFVGDAYTELETIAKAAGLSVEAFQTCLRDENEMDRIQGVAEHANKEYGITGTPTFVINGKMHANMSYPDFEKLLDGLLAAE